MFIKILFLVLFNSLLIFNNAHADKINNIKISGNDRISDQTIILFSGVNINDDIGTNEINNIIKKLYETTFFSDISIKFDNNLLSISVIENPLIQSIFFDEFI